MQQLTLFDKPLNGRIVNVASVPQLSPFRYPGGKTWLVPYLRRWLSPQIRQAHHLKPYGAAQFIEPFAGGGISSLTVASEGLADHITMVEIDEDIATVWQTILHEEHWAWLAEQITSFDLTIENVEMYLARTDLTLRERAFKTLLRNRINRGGILAPGAGRIKEGEGGRGIKSRWYPETLKKRIQYIVKLQSRISFIQGDGLEILAKYACHTDAVFFIDPPYTAAGKKAGSRLYRYCDIDHHALFECASKLQGDFLMTYDDTDEIRSLAQKHGFDIQLVPMKNTHHAQMRELLIGPDLKWLQPIS
ncbi:MAG TPA: DNA adenine methylase [Ktedonobacteraceae bacterium]|nr:DNA adenine methylase [Ktedonobacteraceae bacterium]